MNHHRSIGVLLVLLALALGACADDDDTRPGGDDDDDDAGDDTTDDDDDDSEPAPPPTLTIACTDSADDVYVTPGDLPPYDPTMRGEIVRCSPAEVVPVDTLAGRLAGATGLAVVSGYASYRVAYRTEREPGVPGVGTGLLLIPDTPPAGPLPLIVAAHGTAGLADDCAPSARNRATQTIVIGWVAAGLPVIAPDYAGLGNEGTQGYGNPPDTAHSVIDAARAAIEALAPGSVDGRVVVSGHSQGGGASIATQALARSYGGADVDVTYAIAFAGSHRTTSAATAALAPWLPINGAAGVTRAVTALLLYADFANLFGIERAGEPFAASVRDFLVDAIESDCIYVLTARLALSADGYEPPGTVGEILDETFRVEVADCLLAGPCTDRAAAYIQRAADAVIPVDAGGAPIALIGGELDVQQTPEDQACLRDTLIEQGVTPATCRIPGVDHSGLPDAGIAYAVDLALGRDAVCPGTVDFGECPR